MTRITVLGRAGYLGSVLVPQLLRQGYAVRVLDNFLHGQASLLDCCICSHFEIMRGDVRDHNTVREAVAGADFIIPLAALVGAPACNADVMSARTTNLDSIRLLLELRSRQQRIVSPCTNSGYGIGKKGVECTEESPLQPISLYGLTKVEAEKAILEAGESISLRLATVFGASPRMRLDLLVNDFVYRAVSDRFLVIFEGHFKRNYIHIRDVAKAFLHAIEHFDAMKNQAYNVGLSAANLSKLELCAKIREQIPEFYYSEAAIGQDPDKRDYIVSNEKIERSGYRTEISIEQGIAELIKAYRILRARRYVNA